ncbi:MAG: tetratricopeptide repeat protein [Polyangiaceae bacterium]|nr:tetratricopeptide repeat protein [Polyangiaceae bacterium]
MTPRCSRLRLVFAFVVATASASMFVIACGWDPSRPFDRESPEVREAIAHLDGGDAGVASAILEEYLSTGPCKEGNIGTPIRVRTLNHGSFDLGLSLFNVAETFGHRFGDEELDAGAPPDPSLGSQRGEQVGCALRITSVVADDPSSPIELRARAHYLQGNLHFLNGHYEEAVASYNKALELSPGMGDAGPAIATGATGAANANRAANATFAVDPVGRDAAWNRAIALRRIEDKLDAGNDASPDASQDGDANQDASGDASQDGDTGQDGGGENDAGDGGSDSGKDSGQNDDKKDAGDDSKDSGKSDDNPKPETPKPEEDAGPPPPPAKQNQDERMLDQLENAPTVQQEAARKVGKQRRVRTINDK